MESQPQNPKFGSNPENFHPCVRAHCVSVSVVATSQDTVRVQHFIICKCIVANGASL